MGTIDQLAEGVEVTLTAEQFEAFQNVLADISIIGIATYIFICLLVGVLLSQAFKSSLEV